MATNARLLGSSRRFLLCGGSTAAFLSVILGLQLSGALTAQTGTPCKAGDVKCLMNRNALPPVVMPSQGASTSAGAKTGTTNDAASTQKQPAAGQTVSAAATTTTTTNTTTSTTTLSGPSTVAPLTDAQKQAAINAAKMKLLENNCGDGVDNNLNGLTDAADPSCQANVNAPGPRSEFTLVDFWKLLLSLLTKLPTSTPAVTPGGIGGGSTGGFGGATVSAPGVTVGNPGGIGGSVGGVAGVNAGGIGGIAGVGVVGGVVGGTVKPLVEFPNCSNGDDDDNDGAIDMFDKDCRTPDCADVVDNDKAGGADLADAKCRVRGPDGHFGPENSVHPAAATIEFPNCSNGDDDDNDGAIDMFDKDCRTPDCSDNSDNDKVGGADLADAKCRVRGYDGRFGPETSLHPVAPVLNCNNGDDDDSDTWIDMKDPDCMPGAGGIEKNNNKYPAN